MQPLFDLEGLELHRTLFEASEHPWGWLNSLDLYLHSFPSRIPDELVEEGACLDEGNGPIHIEDGARIEFGAVIRGPAFIGRGTVIGDHAHVSGAFLLGDNVIGHCSQIRSSIFLLGARAPHLNYVGNSVVGRNVNLGAGAILSNLPLDSRANQGIQLTWAGQQIDSGMRKLGALIGDETKIGCNCVLNPGTILGKNCRVYGIASIGGTKDASRRIHPETRLKDSEQRRP